MSLVRLDDMIAGGEIGVAKRVGFLFRLRVCRGDHLLDKLREPIQLQQKEMVRLSGNLRLAEPEVHKCRQLDALTCQVSTRVGIHVLYIAAPVKNLVRQVGLSIEG